MIRQPHRLSHAFAGVALALAAPAAAFNPQPEPPGSVAIGITAAQTAQIHVSWTQPSRDDFPPDPCRFEVAILDATGETLFATLGEVALGQTLSTDLPAASDTLEPGERLILRAMVHFVHPNKKVREACAAATRSALEIFTTETGVANVVIGIGPSVHPPDPV